MTKMRLCQSVTKQAKRNNMAPLDDLAKAWIEIVLGQIQQPKNIEKKGVNCLVPFQ